MRRDAKAPSAGLTQRQATGLGRILRGALATRGSSPDDRRTRTSSTRRASLPLLAVAVLVVAIAAAIPASAAGGPAFLAQFGSPGSGAGHVGYARDIAVSPNSGPHPNRVYVGDQSNERIDEFTVWGTFVRAWGFGVLDGSDELQVCTAETGCQGGLPGAADGQIKTSPMGVALDSEGNLYLEESTCCGTANRIQKFDLTGSEPAFVWTAGGEVNKTAVELREEQEAESEPVTVTEAEENLCTAASGDQCGAGVSGSGDGEFASSTDSPGVPAVGSKIAITPSDDVYVGDNERIERFNTDGEYQDEISVPGEGIASLATGSSGNLYAAYRQSGNTPKPEVHKLNSSGSELATFSVEEPTAIEIGPEGEVYVYDEDSEEALQFSSGGSLEASFAGGDITESSGIGTNSVGDVYISQSSNSGGHVSIYGPPPVELEPPPPVAPSIDEQTVTSVGTESAVVRAKINPHFWDDATYYVQYGPQACLDSGWTEGCSTRPASPAALSTEVTNADVTATATLPGLSPHTAYHYRFAAQSGGGGPVFGLGGTEAEAGEAGAFTTYATPVANASCPNQPLRTGPSAELPDCRAYEMVSPVEKNGGDIVPYQYPRIYPRNYLAYPLDQSSLDGDKITYTAASAFAGAQSSTYLNQYLSTRRAGEGWSTESVNPPERGGIIAPALAKDIWHAFSPDLGRAWLGPQSDVSPLPGAVPGVVNLYGRDNATAAYASLGSGEHAHENCEDPEIEQATGVCPFPQPEVQGHSADGGKAIYRVNNVITADAAKSLRIWQLYESSEGQVHLLSVLPSGAAYRRNSSAGTDAKGGGVGGGYRTQGTSMVENAVSPDAARVYWTAGPGTFEGINGAGALYLRLNGERPASAQEHGSAVGKGDLSVVSATALLTEGSASFLYFGASGGSFAVGEPISGEGIPAGATIAAVTASSLTISAPATKSGGSQVKSGSTTVTNVSASTGGFAAGQTITGAGIPFGTTVSAVGAGQLTLSQPPSAGGAEVALEAFSACTEADKACTVPVSGTVTGSAARFWGATPDGSRAIFTVMEGPLMGNLYEFDAATEESTLIAGGVEGVLGASEDLSRIYLVSTEDLDEGGPGEEGEFNLYLEREGAFDFVAALTAADVDVEPLSNFKVSPVSSMPNYHDARVSPDGRHVAFVSSGQPTGYDNRDRASGQADREVYTYEAGGALACASCNPSGARPAGAEIGPEAFWAAAWIPGHRKSVDGPLHPLSADGSRVFFNSLDALAPRDTNGVEDVYEWERPGAGDCTTSSPTYSASNEGCVSLVSSGQSTRASQFVDASTDGRDVFIRTASSLLPQDPGLVDIYDAREGGGFAQPEEASECEGDACQSVPAAPQAKTPASAGFHGPGNQAQRRDCGGLARQAKKLSRRAKRLRRQAKAARRSGKAAAARKRGRKSARLAKRARKKSKGARKCRRANRRARR